MLACVTAGSIAPGVQTGSGRAPLICETGSPWGWWRLQQLEMLSPCQTPRAPSTATPPSFATLGWVDWWNHRRLHGACDDTPAAEFESRYYAEQPAVPVA